MSNLTLIRRGAEMGNVLPGQTEVGFSGPVPRFLLVEKSRDIPGLQEHLTRLHHSFQIYTFDQDHSITDYKPLSEAGRLSPRLYQNQGLKADLENFDLVALLAVLRKGVHICTGKGANARKLSDYLKERFAYWTTVLDFIDNQKVDDSFPGAEIKAIRPFLVFSTGNGGFTHDVLEDKTLISKPIPLTAWEGMQENRDLLFDSTTDSRKAQIARVKPPRIPYDPHRDNFSESDRVTDQLHFDKYFPPHHLNPILDESGLLREIEPELTEAESTHRQLLAADVRDHSLFIEGGQEIGGFTKANYVFDFARIIDDPALNQRWLKATDVRITNFDAFMQAFRVLSQDWGIDAFPSFAQDILFIDVVAKGINKGLSSRLVKNIYQWYLRSSLAQKMAKEPKDVKMPKIYSLAMIDNPTEGSNDADLRNKNAGTLVVGYHQQKIYNSQKTGPLYGDLIYPPGLKNAQMTNLYLKDVIRIISPQFGEQIIQQVEKEFTGKSN